MIRARKRFGQHFLHDPGVLRRIAAAIDPRPGERIVEIGPGRGALTQTLAARAGRLLTLEIDAELAATLQARFAASSHVEVRQADARGFEYRALRALGPDPGGRVLVVGNLPYSVGKPILAALVEAAAAIDEMALMLQKEVAERVAAEPGGKTYGALSVLTQVSVAARLAFLVPPGAFSPPPQVDSAVLHLRARTAPPVPVADARRLRAVVRAAFAQRRKSLANALAGGLGLPAERARAVLAELRIDPTRRAETLSLAEFARLAATVA